MPPKWVAACQMQMPPGFCLTHTLVYPAKVRGLWFMSRSGLLCTIIVYSSERFQGFAFMTLRYDGQSGVDLRHYVDSFL